MIDYRIKQLVDKVLNDVGVSLGNEEDVSYYCPFCKKGNKRKFEVNLDPDIPQFGRYGCWVCKHRNNSTGTNLFTLFNKVRANIEYVQELKSLLKSRKLGNFDKIYTTNTGSIETQKMLPEQYFPLWQYRSTPEYKNAIHYARQRGITDSDLIRFGIGYCETGDYAGKIIMPSYDSYGQLNFYTARNYYENKFGRHKTPNWSKDIIGYELFINWKLPLILVEGAMDAIAAKRNAIPLFGKNISESLQRKILQEKVTDIYIALDPDAIKDLIPIAQMFMGYGINTYIVKLTDDLDPSKLGYLKFMELIKNTKKATFKELIQFKLGF